MPDVVNFESRGGRDGLTGLVGPDAVHTALSAWQADAQGQGENAPVHVMLLGLGRFDTVNLAYGQAAGDGALTVIAQRIQHFAQDELEDSERLVARLGGGKFLLAAHEACSRERWQWLAEALADAIALPIAELGIANMVRLWPRIAMMQPTGGESSSLILDRLAETLEQGQGQHSRRVLWADDSLTVPGKRSAMVDADLLAAIDRDEIEIFLQPQIALKDEAWIGAEALARWQHPELGLIGAKQLFIIADRTDHVAQLSRHIAAKALATAASWPPYLRLSINVTPADLAAPSFGREMLALIECSGFDATRVTLEITEHVLLDDLTAAASQLQILRDTGVRIALDDFGAGFCNFSYLKLLPLDAIKLDRSMVNGIAGDVRDLAILRAIIAMAGALDLATIAEGVESEEQHAVLLQENVQFYQGFLCAKPLSPQEFAERLAD
ncbi:MAG: bifunctional diguanylate cyclase/phosphodiesterase [Pontixanthobacter sp.]